VKARPKKCRIINRSSIAPFVLLVAALSASVAVISTFNTAEAILVPLEEHWKYNVFWTWDDQFHRTIGIISPKIIIQNETTDRLEGYIADQNGTRLSMYNGEQYVMVRYAYDNGPVTNWELDTKIYNGTFVINIPSEQSNADIVGLYIGNNRYTVDNGTPYTPQSWVFINSARLDYHRTLVVNSTLIDTGSTEVAQQAHIAQPGPSEGSLIDRILSYYGLLPV